MKQYTHWLLLFFFIQSFSQIYSQPSFRNIALSHYHRYPKMEIQDYYKLVYQAAMGNEHLMVDTSALSQYLFAELASVNANLNEPLLEFISPDSSLARINLRPFKALGRNPKELLDAMLKTAKVFIKSRDNLQNWWSDIEKLSLDTLITCKKADLQQYFQSIQRQNYPAQHHSQQYASFYKPAYRVALVKYLQNIIQKKAP
ncbi:MAG: hypothetical protein V1799_00155 [bacterium]